MELVDNVMELANNFLELALGKNSTMELVNNVMELVNNFLELVNNSFPKRKQQNNDHDETPRAARPPVRPARRPISEIGALAG
jgi:hypothetical protein